MRRAIQEPAKRNKEQRPAWHGFLKFGLVTIPVNAFPAKSDRGDIELHWLHETCHNRIRQEKICPVHGKVSNDEIVSGYKYGKDQYIIIDPDELQKLRAKSEDTIDVATVVGPHDIDDIYYTDKTYYLLPDGDAGTRPYAVFQEALKQERLYGLAEGVLFRREHLIVVRPIEGMLIFTFLTYPEGVKSPNFFANRLPRMKNTSRELEMAKALISQLVDPKFDIHEYHDSYAENLMKLIQAKAKGQEIEAPQEEKEPAGLDFMEALKRSLRKGGKTAPVRRGTASPARKRRAS